MSRDAFQDMVAKATMPLGPSRGDQCPVHPPSGLRNNFEPRDSQVSAGPMHATCEKNIAAPCCAMRRAGQDGYPDPTRAHDDTTRFQTAWLPRWTRGLSGVRRPLRRTSGRE